MKGYPRAFVEHRTGDGSPVWMPEVHAPWINPCLLDSVFYLYSSEGTAKAGTQAGGSGFFVKVPSTNPANGHIYAVTNRHVIEGRGGKGKDGSLVLRVNTHTGDAEPIPTAFDAWERSTVDDLAVLALQPSPERFDYWPIPTELFLDTVLMGMAGVGPGDDVAVLGRFIAHDGKQRNKPLARFGNISMMPDPKEPIGKPPQVGFLVECRSLSGFSGSPVLLYPDMQWRPKGGPGIPFQTAVATSVFKDEPRLLGVVCSNVAKWSAVCEKQDPDTVITPVRWVETNSGVSVVIPVWQLLKLLETERLVSERKKQDQQDAKEEAAVKTTIPLSAESDEPEFTKSEFESALKKVSRKLSDEEKS